MKNDPDTTRPESELPAALRAWARRQNRHHATERLNDLASAVDLDDVDRDRVGWRVKAVEKLEEHVRRDAQAEKDRKRGGHASRVAPPDEVLQAEVESLTRMGESLTHARRRVAKRHGLSLSTVRRHTHRPPATD